MIEKKILAANEQFHLFGNGDSVTVACSGGADSMSLLFALWHLRESLHITVSVAHYNHGIRGDEAERDVAFVARFCEENGIPFVTETGDVPGFAAQNGLGLETAARILRYDFLNRAANGGLVSTAHTASDNLETMLLNLMRGSGSAGLSGIPPKRDNIIRPLIFCTRDEVENYCKKNQIPFVTDSTNDQDFCDRNRLRHHVIPQLKAMNPTIEESALRAALLLRDDDAALNAQANAVYDTLERDDASYLIAPLRDIPKAVAMRVLKIIARAQVGESLDFLHLSQLYNCCLQGGKISLPNDRVAFLAKNRLVFSDKVVKPVTFQVTFSKKMSIEQNVHNLFYKNTIDCDKIIGNLTCRTRQPGDEYRLHKAGGTKTLKKLYNEYHIPLAERENLPVVTDDIGIVWVAKLGVAERCAVTEQTKRIIKIALHKGES